MTELQTINQPTVSLADVTGDLHLIARSPAEMQTARESFIAWCVAKISIVARDVRELEESLRIAETHGMKTPALKRQVNIAAKRLQFYEKIKAAAEAGYCIVPNFPVDVIAVRTCHRSGRHLDKDPSKLDHVVSENPALGEGRYVDRAVDTWRSLEKYQDTDYKGDPLVNAEGKPVMRNFWQQGEFDEEFEFPVSIARPEVMSATAEAMAVKCFDEIGVLGVPARRGSGRAKGDPIVVGMINDPRSTSRDPKWVTFMIAWYIDTRAL